jgi:protein-arginine deiminase
VSTTIDLRADVNRNGVVETNVPSEDLNENTWDATHGAVFLANMDDDQDKCPSNVSDTALAACFDAANSTVDGTDDLADLARLKTVPMPSASGTGTITWSPASAKVRLFKNTGGTFNAITSGSTITNAELKAGVEFAIEGTDILRTSAWNGTVDVTVTAGGQSDVVRMRMSPVMLSHHVQNATNVYTTYLTSTGSSAFRADMSAACSMAGTPYTELNGLSDQWTEDFFETGYMSMPAAGGAQKTIRVYFRSANHTGSLRAAGKVVYTYFHGKDKAGITQYDPNHPNGMDSLNSFGNTETIPPYTGYPLGRILRGNVSGFYPDQSFEAMLTAQGVQPQVFIDTAWLLVGHVDETLSFVKANTPRGWVLLVNDAALAKTMLENAQNQGFGSTQMFVGKQWSNGSSATRSITSVLNDAAVMGPSNEAVVEVNSQLAILKAQTGLTDSEIIKIPFLHWKQSGYSVAYQPGTVNLTYVGPTVVASPKPHGPVINGKDIFEDHMEKALAPHGITVKWTEDWDLYHRLLGEVHCGSNADRQIPGAWWVSGK